ncbi:MAG: hypothetical protein M3Y56_12910 [Armatimonadota bacterium]|nr:hypothetical protein [Armatimonadota bacterium]
MKIKEVADRRRELKETYKNLYERLNSILFSHDPIGIDLGNNKGEYEPEVGAILPRLKEVTSVDELRRVVHEEFIHWFGAKTAGPESRYDQVAAEFWQVIGPREPSTNKTVIESIGGRAPSA